MLAKKEGEWSPVNPVFVGYKPRAIQFKIQAIIQPIGKTLSLP